ncbi:hypothetical protein SSS_02236 [Sarcoptes scabiei]|uniref:BZIP domain-containing protein n=1 Tax=Sarcoptes scabiei TaxID=52283 RepID=A0A132A1R9_SARSC|nr:hypothetical protein SSS_02236 [Sarcoptes scabiei]KPM04873.1 stress-related bZIP transcription factor-like protein [Sarcoptes scabiei]
MMETSHLYSEEFDYSNPFPHSTSSSTNDSEDLELYGQQLDSDSKTFRLLDNGDIELDHNEIDANHQLFIERMNSLHSSIEAANSLDSMSFAHHTNFSARSVSPSSSVDDRTQTRRLKNRESAARSRQKIKNLLIELETSMKKLQSKKEALNNERFNIMKEVDELESKMLNAQIKFFKDRYSDEEISLN